jgi:hypothetical protein
MRECEDDHRYWKSFNSLPVDQSGIGRHKCAGCAYELGFAAGVKRENSFDLDFSRLLESQAGAVRHKSPHAAFAQGYLDGVHKSYEKA